MKLINRIILHISWVLTLLLAAWASLFYFAMVDEINDEVDDSLEFYSEMLITRSLAGRELPSSSSGSNNSYYLREVTSDYADSHPSVAYSDEEIYIPEMEESEPARVLRTIFEDCDGRLFELTVLTPSFEKDDLLETILWCMVWLYLLLLLTILLVNVLVLHRILRPLYALLRWLDSYTVGRANEPLDNDTRVPEFRRLNEAAIRNAARAEYLFDRQKQFIGNASHEMQTPLAVCRNRLEMLVDTTELSEEQMGEIFKVQQTLDYLVQLNRSLLLLSKIEGGQFPECEQVDFNALARRAAADFGELYAARRIRIELREEGALHFRMNPSLAASVVNNLLKNACVHGGEGGEVEVTLTRRSLRVANTATGGPLDGEHIFERFYQGTKKEGSTGLGLSIVDAVCRLYGLHCSYAFVGGRHTFTVDFPQ